IRGSPSRTRTVFVSTEGWSTSPLMSTSACSSAAAYAAKASIPALITSGPSVEESSRRSAAVACTAWVSPPLLTLARKPVMGDNHSSAGGNAAHQLKILSLAVAKQFPTRTEGDWVDLQYVVVNKGRRMQRTEERTSAHESDPQVGLLAYQVNLFCWLADEERGIWPLQFPLGVADDALGRVNEYLGKRVGLSGAGPKTHEVFVGAPPEK